MNISKQTFSNYYLPFILFLIALCSKLFFIQSRDICLDEPFTIFHAQSNFWEIIKLPTQNEPNPPLFMLLLHFWIKLFGISASAVRVLPLLFNAITVVYLFLIGKKIANLRTALFVSGLFILSTYHFYFGLETRTYSLLTLATAASLYYFLSIIRNPESKKFFIALLIANLVLIYSHYFGLLVVFVQFVSSFMYLRDKKLFRTLLMTTLLTAIGFIPMMPILIKQFFISSKGTWIQAPSNSEYLNQIWWFLNSKLVFSFIIPIIILGIAYMFISKRLKKITAEIFIIFLWWFIPFTLMFFVSQKMPLFINRYILFTSIGFYLTIAFAIMLSYKKIYAYIIGGLIVVLMFTQVQINSKEFYYREVKNAVEEIKNEVNSSSIILIYPHWADLGFMYYYNREAFKDIDNYDSLLVQNKIIRVWDSKDAIKKLENYHNNKILFFQDGLIDDHTVYNYLDSSYIHKNNSYYPQCFKIGFFDPK